MNWTITGGSKLTGTGLSREPVHLTDGTIAATCASDARTFDAAGDLVLPGIVDIHGDAFERQVMPRPRVTVDLDVALHETDRQLVANGITTAFYGVTISWEPGLRSLDSAAHIVAGIGRLRAQLACDTYIHYRWETFALEALETVCAWLDRDPGAILAFNDHTTGSVESGAAAQRIGSWAERAGIGIDEYRALLDAVWARRDAVPAAIERAAERARAAGVVLLAHDETSPEERGRFRALGAVASEFPMNAETAREARDAGEQVILGAPNVLRGGSHTGAMCATEASAADLCSVLASDYYYPAPLLAAFRLVDKGTLELARAWAMVSTNAAIAAGLPDRGTLEPRQRGDVVVVDTSGPHPPRVVATFVAGRKVYESR